MLCTDTKASGSALLFAWFASALGYGFTAPSTSSTTVAGTSSPHLGKFTKMRPVCETLTPVGMGPSVKVCTTSSSPRGVSETSMAWSSRPRNGFVMCSRLADGPRAAQGVACGARKGTGAPGQAGWWAGVRTARARADASPCPWALPRHHTSDTTDRSPPAGTRLWLDPARSAGRRRQGRARRGGRTWPGQGTRKEGEACRGLSGW